MAYRRRRQGGSPWPTFLVTLIVLLIGGYVFRHSIETEGNRLAGRVTVLAKRGAPTAVVSAAAPTFTVVVDQPIPLANVPAPELTAAQFLNEWSTGKYSQMYGLLSKEARSAHTQQQFVQRYTDLTNEATIAGVTTHITSIPTIPSGAGNGASVQVPFTVAFKTIRVGTFEENNSVSLVLEDGQWRVDWQPSLFFSGLDPNDTVRLFPLDPRRGSIVDRKGRPLAMMGFQETIGVVPADLAKGGQEDQTLQIIGQYLHKTPADLKKTYANQPPDWFIPLGDVSGTLENELHQKLDPLPGVALRRKPIRVYPQGEVASHIVGYIGHITTDELTVLKNKGYTIDDIVGRAGVEQWADSVLAGQRGGKLAVVAPSGEVVRIIAQRDAVPGDDVVLSIDLDIQKEAEQVLGKLDGSVVVMNPQDNSVLALATYPNFDPNKFVTGFTPQEWQALNTSPNRPFLNRPVEAAYPTGSIFKVITASAGMETLNYTASSMFDCSYWWHGPGGLTLHNWTPQGHLNLIQSITGSCDPTFYSMGVALDQKSPTILPDFARKFGLGAKTGINGVNEVTGLVPDPAWKKKTLGQPWYLGDTVNLSIGQGYLEATPMQMANLYSAIANDGARRTPVLVWKEVDQKGNVDTTFEAQSLGRLPDSANSMKILHEGMLGVTSDPLGTAYYAFQTYKHPMEAKTGSAENQNVLAHAWFVGYTPPTHPTYLILVMVEGRGESMQIASPMARQLMEFLWPSSAAQIPSR